MNWAGENLCGADLEARDQEFGFGHIKFEMVTEYPNEDIKLATGYKGWSFNEMFRVWI